MDQAPTQQEALEHAWDKTRRSLIERLENWEDQKTWDEFYQTYWRLIYAFASRAGLRDDECWEVVQETIVGIAKQSQRKLYDPEKGSFKSWLLTMARWRIGDQFKRRNTNAISDETRAQRVVFCPLMTISSCSYRYVLYIRFVVGTLDWSTGSEGLRLTNNPIMYEG